MAGGGVMEGIDRDPCPFWKNREGDTTIQFYTGEVDILPMIEARVAEAEAEMARQLQISMYGDREPLKVKTRWQALSGRLNTYWQRAQDAWLVLTGKAGIGDC